MSLFNFGRRGKEIDASRLPEHVRIVKGLEEAHDPAEESLQNGYNLICDLVPARAIKHMDISSSTFVGLSLPHTLSECLSGAKTVEFNREGGEYGLAVKILNKKGKGLALRMHTYHDSEKVSEPYLTAHRQDSDLVDRFEEEMRPVLSNFYANKYIASLILTRVVSQILEKE